MEDLEGESGKEGDSPVRYVFVTFDRGRLGTEGSLTGWRRGG